MRLKNRILADIVRALHQNSKYGDLATSDEDGKAIDKFWDWVGDNLDFDPFEETKDY